MITSVRCLKSLDTCRNMDVHTISLKNIESSSKTNSVSKKWIFVDSWINKGIQLHLIMTYIHPNNPIYPIIRDTYGYTLILKE